MKSTSPIPLPVNRSLARLGDALSRARRRRQFTQQDLASRIGSSITTVQRMEAGHPGTAIVHIARALQVFGELDKLDEILDLAHDPIGLILSDQQLPQRVRPKRGKHQSDKKPTTRAKRDAEPD